MFDEASWPQTAYSGQLFPVIKQLDMQCCSVNRTVYLYIPHAQPKASSGQFDVRAMDIAELSQLNGNTPQTAELKAAYHYKMVNPNKRYVVLREIIVDRKKKLHVYTDEY